MRLAIVVPGGFDRSGRDRIVPALLWLVERLASRHEVHVIVLDYYEAPTTYPLAGATIHDLGRVAAPRGLRRVAMGRRLGDALGHLGRFDLLHAFWGVPAGVLTAEIARRTGMPAVVTFDSGELVAIDDIRYGLQRRWIDRRAIERTLRDAAAITVCTNFMAEKLAPSGRMPPRIVPIGVDTTRFPAAARRDGPPWRLVRVGSLNPVKDHDTLLRAMRIVCDRLADVHLDLVGEDTRGGAVQRLAASLDLADRVVFHGVQPTDRVAALYQSAHLHVVSSRHEAANVATLEAAASGIATVGTAVGYVADWHPERAVSVPIGDAAALATAIVELLIDSARRTRLAAAARAWTLAHDADWTARAFEEVYAEVIADIKVR